MKKLLLLLVLLPLAFAGCIEDNGEWNALRKVAPGINIYNFSNNQMVYTMQQSNVGMRLAVLLAEAKKQGVTNLDELKVTVDKKEVKVKDALLGASTKVEKLTNGDYKITFTASTGLVGSTQEGVMTVSTNGQAQLDDTNSSNFWSVSSGEKFSFKYFDNGSTVTVSIIGGETIIYAQGDGSYLLIPRGIRFTHSGSKVEAQWGAIGSQTEDFAGLGFRLTAPEKGLAFSDCSGKLFSMSGAAGGPSFYSLDGVSATKMMYEVNKGKYLGSVFVNGSAVCRLTGGMDYNMSEYVSDFVVVDNVFDEERNRVTQTITYNGNKYTVVGRF